MNVANQGIDFVDIIVEAWKQYDPTRAIRSIVDISLRVSTNHVFSVRFGDGGGVFAKCSYFGKYEHFREDHQIINVMANTLPPPYENFLSRSLTRDGEVFTHRHQHGILDTWVVFYHPIPVANMLPRRLDLHRIQKMGSALARFHKVCVDIREELPPAAKTLETDVYHLLDILKSEHGKFEHRGNLDAIREQCDRFLENSHKINFRTFVTLPVFVDWNIGNFSIADNFEFYSRWDYDWFRVSSRIMDFYFFSRVCSDIGDKTTFSYYINPLMEERFIVFLQAYHKVFPLTANEIRFLGEAYRFFILNYVVKDGRYFFHHVYATRLLQEALQVYLPTLEKVFNPEGILKALDL